MGEVLNKVVDFFSSPSVAIVVAAFVTFIIIRFVYRKIFKKNSVRLIVSVITVCIIIFIIFYRIVVYMQGMGAVYLEDDMNYVYGKVEYVDLGGQKIIVDSVRSNLKKGGTGRVEGNITFGTKVLYNNKAIEDKLNLSDIKTGDFVYLVINEDSLDSKDGFMLRAILKPVKTSIFSILFNEKTELTDVKD